MGAAESLDDLRVPPGNRLEALRGDRAGQHSIRINDQWRICFVWGDAGPEEVEMMAGDAGLITERVASKGCFFEKLMVLRITVRN